jgi:2-hydroxycyclohexanecarboxyl-CoA dehydrogenase
MDLRLKGRMAIITGGASGIGLACTRGLASEGCHVAIWDVAHTVVDVASQIAAEFGVKAIGISVDVSSLESVTKAVSTTEQAVGPIQHLVHAAAITSGQFGFPFTNVAPKAWHRVLDINVMGMVHVAQSIAPGLIARRDGTMVFVASVAGQIGSQTDPPYSASKAANINFAQCLAKDLAPHHVRVNTVNPGMVQTPLNRQVWQAWHDLQPPEGKRSYEDWAGEKVRNVVPLGRWQSAEDIADMVAFLSSERAAQVTGQTINVDGGFVMHW